MEPTDEELMTAYCQGSIEAFELLYSRYENRLKGFLKNRLRSQDLPMASDLFQITWLKLHQSRSSFQSQKKFSAWFFTVALNTLRDYVRESRPPLSLESDPIDTSKSMREDPLGAQELKALERDLQMLPVEWREVLLLTDWEGFQSSEVATMKGLSEDNVRQILSRARKTLKAGGHGRA